jgi:hypothetical protein
MEKRPHGRPRQSWEQRDMKGRHAEDKRNAGGN